MSPDFSKNRVSESAEAFTRAPREVMESYPVTSALIAFGLGLGTGLVLADLLTEQTPVREKRLTENLVRQLMDAISRVVPESLSSR